ncbi:MAG: acyl-CoA dehydrogenase family protein, partial [Myxococcota bacterium]
MISFGPTEEQELIRDTVREFAMTELREVAREFDEAERMPEEILQKTWELGLVNSAIPEEYGGAGLDRSPVTNVLVLEELAYGDVSLGLAAMAPALFVMPLLDFGSDEQKQAYLPELASSSFHAVTLALSEPSFVFDPANLRTIAE